MLDIKQLRSQTAEIQAKLDLRGGKFDLAPIIDLDRSMRELETQRSQLQAESNEIGKQVGQKLKSQPDDPELPTLRDRANQIKQ